MQFHIFTGIFTIIIYIYLRYNKEEYNGDYSIYAIIIPILLYSYSYLNENKISKIENMSSESSLSLMTEIYPISSSI